MKKALLTIICAFVLTGTLFPAVSHAAAGEKPPLYNATFDVGKALDLGDDQDQTYYKDETEYDKNRSPIVELIVFVIEFVTKVIGSISMILVIIGGLVLIVSQGNQQTIDKGKEIIKYAFFGLMITFGSYTIAIFIQSIFYAE